MDTARLQTIYEESGRPGARAFRTAARKKGANITTQEAQQFVAQQSTAQVLQGRLPSDGKVTASRVDSRWQLDLMDFSKRKKQPGGHRYVLMAVDVFSKIVYCERLTAKKDKQVLTAYRKIIGRNDNTHPKEVSTDLGKEFGPSFTAYLKDNGTANRKKDPQSVNSIAAVDRAMQSIKVILANLQASSDAPWSSLLKKSTDIYNDKEHSALYGESPGDVAENDEVQYMLEAQAGKDIKHNNDRWRSKAGRLTDKAAFRIPEPRKTWERIDAPRFKGEVHQVASLKGANVEDTEGRSYPVRKVLAVPANSADIDVNEELVPASGKREQQKQGLRRYAEQLKQELSGTPQGTMTLVRVRMFLRTRAQFEDNATLYRLPVAGRYVKFLRLFGFEITGSGPSITVRTRAAQAGGGGRPAGAVDMAPRMPRRELPGATAITWQPDNPHRGGTLAYSRYDLYKGASTVAEARRLGATPQDIKNGLAKGYAQL